MRPEHRLPPAYRAIYAVIALLGCAFVIAVGLRHETARTGGPKRKAPRMAQDRRPLRGVVVVLDPGHGGVDSGAICRGCREDAVNYRLTATMATALRDAGAQVAFTVRSAALDVPLREGTPEPPLVIPQDARLIFNGGAVHGTVACLYQRAAAARPFWEALATQERASGRGLYFLSIHHDDSWGARGARVAYDRRSGPPPLATVLARRLAEVRRNQGREHNDPRALGVLNPTYNPVRQRALLEAATISNATDRDLARSRQWRWMMAHLVADAISECEGRLVTAR
jgi:N-acetylmuramoyl-L-alanine amidase